VEVEIDEAILIHHKIPVGDNGKCWKYQTKKSDPIKYIPRNNSGERDDGSV